MAKKKYFLDVFTFNKIKSLSFAEMNEWIESLYTKAFMDGVESVKATDVTDVLKEISKVNGIGKKRLGEIEKAIERLD